MMVVVMFSKSDKDLNKLFKLQESLGKAHDAKKARDLKKNPPPPKVRKPKMTPEQIGEEYIALRRRVINAIAANYIIDHAGREAYKRTASAYAVVGKYKINSAFIDWDHELRDINTMAGGPERNKVLKALCKRLGA